MSIGKYSKIFENQTQPRTVIFVQAVPCQNIGLPQRWGKQTQR
jgi:hypothetical protein